MDKIERFLLRDDLAVMLYQEVESLPIIDYHNHISPRDIATARQYGNLAEIWVTGDPYKHRAMRICGVAEEYITGNASDYKKYSAWAETLPKTIGNPLFHWSQLEMFRVFGIQDMLDKDAAKRVWEQSNQLLEQADYSALNVLKRWNIEMLCTSDHWLEDLKVHQSASSVSGISIRPSLRADAALSFQSTDFMHFLRQLENCISSSVSSLEEYEEALLNRLRYFQAQGCIFSDHALDVGFSFELPTAQQASSFFQMVLKGKPLTNIQYVQLQSYVLYFLSKQYARMNWTMQLHVGAYRTTSTRLRKLAGTAGGYAAIGGTTSIVDLCKFFDALEQVELLPDIILYNLSPGDNETFAVLTGSFVEDGKPAKVQFGPAWWYNDHLQGIENHLLAIANYSLLSQFIGMTTDSRSILSFSRHEYFRRILCTTVSSWVSNGVLPNKESYLIELVRAISYDNAKRIINDAG
ncbi:MAG: glucuronate isomerase [Bacteroidota bacterium]